MTRFQVLALGCGAVIVLMLIVIAGALLMRPGEVPTTTPLAATAPPATFGRIDAELTLTAINAQNNALETQIAATRTASP